MSVLSKIRENVGLVILIIAISLVVFILTDLFRGLSGGRGGDNALGYVAGEPVDPQAYSAAIENFRQRMQGQSLTADQEAEMQNAAFNQVVNEMLLKGEYEQLGLMVSDDELSQMFLGPWVSMRIRQDPAFQDASGQYSPDTVVKRLSMAESIDLTDANISPAAINYKAYMDQVSREIVDNRLQERYSQLLYNSVFATTNEVRRRHADENTRINLSYVAIPYSSISDDAVQVSDADYQAEYDKRKKQYERELEATIEYAIFNVIPSRADSAEKRDVLSKLAPEFMEQDSASVLKFALDNTDATGIDTTHKPLSQLPAIVSAGIPQFGTDTIYGPVLDREANSFAIYRVTSTRETEKPVVKARHILVTISGTTAEDTTKARAKANAIRNMVNKDNFAQVAQDSSKDFITQGTGGDLGWITEGNFGPGSEDFDKNLMEQGVGSIYVAESGRGFHVVEILDKSNKQYQVVGITREIIPGYATADAVSQKANQFASKAAAVASLDSASKEMPGVAVLRSQPLNAGASNLAGVKGARPVIVEALKGETGQMVKEVIKTENAYVVARVISRHDKGYLSLDEVKDRLRPIVYNKKKAEAIRQKIASAGQDLNAVAAASGTGATVQTAGNISFFADPNQPMAGISSEHLVIGAAFSLQQGQTSAPINGNGGVYVVRVDGIQAAPAMEEAMLPGIKKQQTAAKRQANFQKYFTALIKSADVQDNRYMRE